MKANVAHSFLASQRYFFFESFGCGDGQGIVGHVEHSGKPPARAARVPVSKSSLSVCPGSRKCTCTSTNPGNRKTSLIPLVYTPATMSV